MTPTGVISGGGGGVGGRLAPAEQAELESQEQIISRGMSTFLDVGNALMTIRQKRLYRASHPTFESYCKQKWGFTKTSANRFISASSVVENLKQATPLVPSNLSESQLRPLTVLKPAEQQKVWQAVINDLDESKGVPRRITANLITKKIREVLPGKSKDEVAASPAPAVKSKPKTSGSVTLARREEFVASVQTALDKWYARNKKSMKAADFSKLKKYLEQHV